MINTVNTKSEQLKNGYFKTGTGNELILIIGSCRSVPYMNYFEKWNKETNRFTVAFIDPFNWNFDLQDNRINAEEKINSLETDETILSMLRSTTIFLHEFYSNFGMFNCDKNEPKNIYQFGLHPEIDICIPNFNNFFILFGDIVSFDLDIRKRAIADYNVIDKLSDQTKREMYEISSKNISKFYDVCAKSDLPEMAEYFKKNFKKVRFYWSHNHVSKHFTFAIFMMMNRRLNLDLKKDFLDEIFQQDLFANNYTWLTEYDMELYHYQWGEEIKPLRSKL